MTDPQQPDPPAKATAQPGVPDASPADSATAGSPTAASSANPAPADLPTTNKTHPTSSAPASAPEKKNTKPAPGDLTTTGAGADAVPRESPATRKADTADAKRPGAATPETSSGGTTAGSSTADGSPTPNPMPKVATTATEAGSPAAGSTAGGSPSSATEGSKDEKKSRTGPWVALGAVAAALLLLVGLGYFGGLGPLNRLSMERGIDPPAKLAGLDRITDPQTRGQLDLDRTRDKLVQINNGKEATVEAYGSQAGDRMYMVIALRGRVDIDKYVKDSGAPADQVKTVGKSTCVTPKDNLPAQCYRGSNTLTVIVQVANDDVTVDDVAPVAVEAFDRMK